MAGDRVHPFDEPEKGSLCSSLSPSAGRSGVASAVSIEMDRLNQLSSGAVQFGGHLCKLLFNEHITHLMSLIFFQKSKTEMTASVQKNQIKRHKR